MCPFLIAMLLTGLATARPTRKPLASSSTPATEPSQLIALNRGTSPVLAPGEFNAQSTLADRTVTGTVSDETGSPLPGVSILVKGTTQGTTTDASGQFRIVLPTAESILVFSYVGYLSQEIAVANQSNLTIKLVADSKSLEEVVVVGYGSVKKSDLTGSVVSVKAEELQRSTISSFDQGLSGRASGVQVTQQSGQPGGATSIRIRGTNSINTSAEPLYVIDGFPYYNSNEAASAGVLNGSPSQNALATINPADIESIEILKDASATAIYGARGANGVILITTRRGKTGKARIDYDGSYSSQSVLRYVPVLNAKQYAEFRNAVWGDVYSQAYIDQLGEGTDWQRAVTRTAPMHNHNLSVSGGTDKVKYLVSGSLLKQDGIVIGSDFDRYSVRANLDIQASDRLKVSNNFTLSYLNSNQIRSGGGSSGTVASQSANGGNVIQDALAYNPIIPIYDAEGNFTSDNDSDSRLYSDGSKGNTTGNTPQANPVASALLSTFENRLMRVLENVTAEYAFTPKLHFRTSLGVDLISNKQNSFIPRTIINARPGGQASVGTLSSNSWLSENTLDYDLALGKHAVKLLGGFTAQQYQAEGLTASGRDFATDATSVFGLNTAATTNPAGSTFNKWSLLSYLFRVNYSLNDQLLVTASMRADGSSRFGANNKYGYFPSAAIAYKLHEASFIKQLNLFDELKVRASAGVTGNQEIPTYQSLSTLSTVRYPTSNTVFATGFAPAVFGNPDIKWETTKQIDLGVDISIFKSRVNLTADYYYKKTSDLLLFVTLPSASGFQSVLTNIGEVQNKGLEFSLNTVNLDGAFRWRTNFNIAFNRNKVLSFGNETQRFVGQNYNLTKGIAVGLIKVGEPLGNFAGLVNDGIIKNEEELKNAPVYSAATKVGARRFKDLNGDGIINNDDRTIIGNALPDFTGGIQNTLSWKGFELDFFFQFVYGNEVYNMNQLEQEFLNGRANGSTTVLDRFVPGVNEDTDVPAIGSGFNIRESHSRWVEDGSFLRLRNLTLGYSIPLKSTKYLRSARVYLNGQNLWLLTKYRGFDPEVNINPQNNALQGFDYSSYPSARTLTAGVRLGF